VDLPVFLYANGDQTGEETGLGDIAADAKATVLDGEDAPVDLAANVRVSFPTATVATALHNPAVGYEVTAVVSREFGPVLLALNAGTRGGPQTSLENVELNDMFVGRLGAGLAFTESSGGAVELSTQVPYSASLSNRAGSPLEFLASGYGYANRDLVIRAGAGGGLSPGVGSPDFRVLVGLGYEPREPAPPVDTDGDGLFDPQDACPTEPEDADSFDDHDGCPDPDNDRDGILDLADDCVSDPEDMDGWQDEEGCPDPNTLLRVITKDAATTRPLDAARIAIQCGESVTRSGTAPYETELPPGSCVVQASAVGYTAASMTVALVDGPPSEAVLTLEPKKEARVIVTRERIELRESIRFETGKATIRKESFGILDETVQILTDYPEIVRLRIEGHTDERGGEAFNLELSKKRAAAVLTYFTGKGIDPARLTSEGYGEVRPLDPAHNTAAWEKNRRTDFFVEVWEDKPVGASP
jgi:outer membrane protein OmpA-like peptidoglycan-associated protein